MDIQSVITRSIMVAEGRFAPGHLGELTQLVPFEMVDAALTETRKVESRLRDLPSRCCGVSAAGRMLVPRPGLSAGVRQYVEERSGPLTSNVPEAGGFVRAGRGPAPDVQFHASPMMLLDAGLAAPNDHAISFGPCVLNTHSRGSVTLASADPTTKPRIRHNYYGEDADLEKMVAGLRIGLEISRQSALARYTSKLYAPPASESDADLREFARRHTQTLFHPAGTCAMGTVLDAELGCGVSSRCESSTRRRCRPWCVATRTPVIAMAEKAADLIRGVDPPPPAR